MTDRRAATPTARHLEVKGPDELAVIGKGFNAFVEDPAVLLQVKPAPTNVAAPGGNCERQ